MRRMFGSIIRVDPALRWISRLHLKLFGTTFLARRISAIHVMPLIRRIPFRAALDAGCNNGVFALTLAAERPDTQIIGVDIDPGQLETAERLRRAAGLENVRFVKEDLRILETFANGAFDLIFTVNVLEHIDRDEQTLRTFHRLLRPGGHLVVYTPAPHAKRLIKYVERFGDSDLHPDHVREGFTLDELAAKVDRAGFTVVDRRYALGFFGELAWELAFFVEKNTYIHGLAYPLLLLLAQGERLPIRRGNAVMVHGRK